MFAKSTMTLVALVLTLDALFVFSKASVTGSRIDLGGNGWNCAHVISHPVDVRRELVSRNLEGDHKIIKFIENCIKSVDGWRFKKSGDSSLRSVSYALSMDPSVRPERVLKDGMPYAMQPFAVLSKGPLSKQSTSLIPSSSSSTSSSGASGTQQQTQSSQQRPELPIEEELQFIGYSD